MSRSGAGGILRLPDRLHWLNMARYWFSRADAIEQGPTSSAQAQGDYRIRSFHHL